MDYKTALTKLEALLALLDQSEQSPETRDQAHMLYGEVEDIITRLVGTRNIQVPLHGNLTGAFPNFIEAGYFSGRSIHQYAGRNELLKVIGKVRQLAQDPELVHVDPSVNNVIQILRRFRECCQYITDLPQNEKSVQDILWIMLRAQFELLHREESLKTFGLKSYKPDFGLPSLRTLIEAKFIGLKTDPRSIQEEILADIPGYLNESSQYDSIIVFVYDHAHKLRNPTNFIEDLEKIDGIIAVIVIPGVGAS